MSKDFRYARNSEKGYKLKVRDKTLTYSKNRKKQTKQRETELEQGIAKLEEELDKRNHSDTQSSRPRGRNQ